MKIALLQADQVDDDLKVMSGDLPHIFQNMFKYYSDISIDTFNVMLGEYPDVDQYNACVMSGSRYSVFDDIPWIRDLHSFVKASILKKNKIVGLCFGHQLIANAMGGQVKMADWNLGVQELQIMNPLPWMIPYSTHLHLLFNHRYQVVKLPAQAKIHAQTDSFIQMFSIDNHLLGLQAHPEYSVPYQEKLMEKTFSDSNNPLMINAKLRNQKNIELSVKTMCQWLYYFMSNKDSA